MDTNISAVKAILHDGASNIVSAKAIFCDVDGVLTDGMMYYNEQGLVMKAFNTRDAAAMSRLKANNIKVYFLTASVDVITAKRLSIMNPDGVIMDCDNKLKDIKQICEDTGINVKECLYIGDDIMDIPAMQSIGYSVCPVDAVPSVIEVADCVLTINGGQGCLALVADLLLKGYLLKE